VSTPTKVFVLLLTVFSIAFTMMTVQYVAQTQNWKALAGEYRQTALAAATHERNTMAISLAEKEVLLDKIQGQSETIAERSRTIDKLTGDLDQTKLALAKSEHDRASSAARETTLAQQMALEQKRANLNTAQKDELAKQAIDLQRRNADLNSRVNELNTTVALQSQQLNGLQQQNFALRDDNRKLRSHLKTAAIEPLDDSVVGKPLDQVERITPAVSGAIRAQIASVQNDIASINVGLADGVREGMVFLISRDNDYVGTLKISTVRPNESGGRLTVDGNRQVQQGDKVIDEEGLVRGL
jgi:flagellar motor protein MotB